MAVLQKYFRSEIGNILRSFMDFSVLYVWKDSDALFSRDGSTKKQSIRSLQRFESRIGSASFLTRLFFEASSTLETNAFVCKEQEAGGYHSKNIIKNSQTNLNVGMKTRKTSDLERWSIFRDNIVG